MIIMQNIFILMSSLPLPPSTRYRSFFYLALSYRNLVNKNNNKKHPASFYLITNGVKKPTNRLLKDALFIITIKKCDSFKRLFVSLI